MKSVLIAAAYFGLIYAGSNWLSVEDQTEAEEMKRNGWVTTAPAYVRRRERTPCFPARGVPATSTCLTADGSAPGTIIAAPVRKP